MMEDFKNKGLFSILVTLLSLFVFVLIVSTLVDIQNGLRETENTITVSDTGTVYAKPDLALVDFSVVTEKETVAEALSENTTDMNAVITAVKAQGVEEKDLKTISFYIYPRYEWHEASRLYPTGERVLVGYEVSQSLQVKIRDMEKIGDIIQAATDAGANQVGDLQLTIDNQDELKAQARAEAITKAKTKAEELAKELGVRLVRFSSFSESGAVPYYYGIDKAESVAIGGGDVTPEIETGENKIEVTVYITYDIR